VVKELWPIGLVLVSNLWIYRIWGNSPVVAVITIISSLCWFLVIKKRLLPVWAMIFMVCLLVGQYKFTEIDNYLDLDLDEARIQLMRLNEYPPIYIKVGEKVLWIALPYWIEARRESVIWDQIKTNLGEAIDPNLYFLANHPRERVGIIEFEKFPYVFLPIFLLGMYELFRNNKFLLIWIGLIPLLVTSMIGHKSLLGAVGMFPVISIGIALGLEEYFRWTNKMRWMRILGGVSIVLVLIQMAAYAKY
jgi:hypothetical protein